MDRLQAIKEAAVAENLKIRRVQYQCRRGLSRRSILHHCSIRDEVDNLKYKSCPFAGTKLASVRAVSTASYY